MTNAAAELRDAILGGFLFLLQRKHRGLCLVCRSHFGEAEWKDKEEEEEEENSTGLTCGGG